MMQDEIKKIEIVLENCEVITIEGKYIGNFGCTDISYSIERFGCNCIDELKTCKDFYISIYRDSALNTEFNTTFGELNETRNPLKRILDYPDITSIYIYLTKDENNPKEFYVTWGDGEYDNEYQKSYMNKFGDLFIVVSEKLKLEDVFDMKRIEDEKYMDYIWGMYGVVK